MRLRYLHLPELPPLEDITITFGYEPILGRTCALHFIVGVNGSGKSRLLRAIAEIFLCLERGVPIPFPATLVYDLGPGTVNAFSQVFSFSENERALAQERHTIYLHRPEEGQTLCIDLNYVPPLVHEDERDWESLANADLEHLDPDAYKIRLFQYGDNVPETYLPKTLLAYTSGATNEWEQLFAPQRTSVEDDLTVTLNNLTPEQERPVQWNALAEIEWQRQQREIVSMGEQIDLSIEYESTRASSMGIFVPPAALKLALCATALDQANKDFAEFTDAESEDRFRERVTRLLEEGRRMQGLRGIFNEIDWLWPVTITLHVILPAKPLPFQTQRLKLLYEAATSVIREPEPGQRRSLFFDLRATPRAEKFQGGNTAQALIQALTPLGNDTTTPFQMFKELMALQRQGILDNLTITLCKRAIDDVILYDWLSDGEQLFLGRMALFHLLQRTEDALILLDEPETHFNDYWKREMVDIIDSSLRDDPVEIMLSTHSSIALSDAFDTEIVLLSKDPEDGSISIEQMPIKSFGASPADIMRDIFHTPESVGQRAAEFLDLMLLMALHPTEVETLWRLEGQQNGNQQLQRSDAFLTLSSLIRQRLPRALNRGEDPIDQLDTLLLRSLRSVYWYTRQVKERTNITMVDALDELYSRLGPGYYQFEFHRRLQQLRRDSNAASN